MESRFLTNFSPGMDGARSRLQWASLRCTTRPEGIAYSLFGIFGLHLPVLYGGSAEKAFGRLWPKSYRSLGFTPAFLPTSPHIKRYHCLHPNPMQRNSHQRRVSSLRRP
ncbi:hypothetical protein PISMIDRAFT_632760 [Pisolithus microcarpus 441]|uniref:Uncharacterized protein n=1 Tax=Pisolithus microcarpus 441 TaxID=765257 RepID=A0A0C9YQ91_9AGAM|nr:hypothetical protein PISMIDRAFT_632760 [Pisolithus microcarpus 441]